MAPKPTLTINGPVMDNCESSNPNSASYNGLMSPWRCLDDHPEVAAELSDILQETLPNIWFHRHSLDRKRSSSRVIHDGHLYNDCRVKTKRRLEAADSLSIHFKDTRVWSTLTAAVASESIAAEESCISQEYGTQSVVGSVSQGAAQSASLVEVNSGGRVFFCFFSPLQAGGNEGCCVLKFVQSRLLCQSEQFANELARYLGVCAPECRIIRANDYINEWVALTDASKRLQNDYPDLIDEVHQSSCALVMEYIPGMSLSELRLPLTFDAISALFDEFGRLIALDMLLGNADRLQCQSLGWRGNPGNVIYATGGRSAGRLVAIDAVVQRRPPGGLMNAEDSACERCVELALNDFMFAKDMLAEAIAGCATAEMLLHDHSEHAVLLFQQGLRAGLEAIVELKGLFEMIYGVTSEWINEFIEDIEGTSPKFGKHSSLNSPPQSPFSVTQHLAASLDNGGSPSNIQNTTIRIRRINQEATHDQLLGHKVSKWRELFRSRGDELRNAIEEWHVKRNASQEQSPTLAETNSKTLAQDSRQKHDCRLSTGFLDGIHPVVDLYELKVRLEHMLQRLRFLLRGTLTGRPTPLLPGLFLSGAVEASSIHILRQLGITHILNATADVLSLDDVHAFKILRVPLQDDEDEEITAYFASSSDFIDEALDQGGGVLVHCQEGRSRSCSIVLAWLMSRHKWTLHQALRFVQERHPKAAPNAGYLAQLARLDAQLYGYSTFKVKKSKPELKCCPVCHDKVGVSLESLRLHIRLKHPTSSRE